MGLHVTVSEGARSPEGVALRVHLEGQADAELFEHLLDGIDAVLEDGRPVVVDLRAVNGEAEAIAGFCERLEGRGNCRTLASVSIPNP